jgi:hypothetical protein
MPFLPLQEKISGESLTYLMMDHFMLKFVHHPQHGEAACANKADKTHYRD